jgi:PII-like signaling protein
MSEQADHRLLRIFVGESDQHGGQPRYLAIMETLRREGLAGATALRGIEGFGRSSTMHTAHILRMSDDLPIVVECIDTVDRIEAALPAIDAIVGDGVVTLERIEMRRPRSGGDGDPKG